MARYRARFERINFGFQPPLVQSADVVFDTDIPFEDEHLVAFEGAAWNAVWKQNPHWKDPHGPVPGSGWSTVMGDGKYVRI